MKKILFAVVGLLMYATVTNAAMTCTGSYERFGNDGSYNLSVVLTFDTTPGTASCAMPSVVQDLIDQGYYIYWFAVDPGATGPTDNSDLAITDSDGRTILAAAGNGANVIDNATVTSWIYGDGPTPGSTNVYPKGNGKAWTIAVTNNAVNNSTATLLMLAIPAKPFNP